MNTIAILFAGGLSNEAFAPLLDGKNSVAVTVERVREFPGVSKTVVLADGGDFSFLSGAEIERRDSWTKRGLLERIAALQEGFDAAYFAFADCPFLDPKVAEAVIDRHLSYTAEYSYSDGRPSGIAPEALSAGTAVIMSKLLGDGDEPVERDALFSIIKMDINAFDIEMEISPEDLRSHRIHLFADTRRNLMLLKNFIAAAGGRIPDAAEIEDIVRRKPEILRTLPSFYNIQVSGVCPQSCSICPYPQSEKTSHGGFMDADLFETLLDNIAAFSNDAVIDLSLWGELSLHPQKTRLIESVLKRPGLSLLIETSGIGWKTEELERCADMAREARDGKAGAAVLPAPLSWIVSLDTADPQAYARLRGDGFAEADACAVKLLKLFPADCYVQAVRIKGGEDDTERFYRRWKEICPNGDMNIIIQKYDDFCGALEKKQASDLSPVIRQCCWHIMRDVPVLIDGTVPLCREDLSYGRILGNVFNDSLEAIWKNGEKYYGEQCGKKYEGVCADCDEYYTYNF